MTAVIPRERSKARLPWGEYALSPRTASGLGPRASGAQARHPNRAQQVGEHR